MLNNQHKSVRFLYWILIGILAFLFLYLLLKLLPLYQTILGVFLRILTPFLIAALIAYLLHPLIEKLHKFNLPRWLVIIGIYFLFFGGAGYLLYKTFPVFIHQLKDLNENLPSFMEQYREAIYGLYEQTAYLPETVHDRMDLLLYRIEEFIGSLLTGIVQQAGRIMDIVILAAVIPVLVFYMLKDFDLIKKTLSKLTPERYRDGSRQLCREIDKSLGNYIRGQLLVCLFVSLTTYTCLWFIDMKYPLLLAIIMGLTNIIPYFGPILGAIPAIVIAFTISTKMVFYVILAVFVVQIVEGNLLSPFIVGKSINIHPILIIFALLAGGEIGGILGMILAVPVITIGKVIIYQIRQFRAAD
ncbi:AI-2E family transporter [Sediminibacillus albus]|uniref:Predicted PurR-regulated permease PerM n=1 Tax=Sediminibacillus albus TaxID=407036 RepID=A0A1G9CKS2_9BACI|nr:AI-2E family transporter [Sediminibacillus albus]SDK52212.1 Predicted PurR-regulated permease PerM [Sediminibacillus albus]